MRRPLGFLLATGSICLGSATAGAVPDTILINGKILTVDQKNTVAEALAISGGRIEAVGRTNDIRKRAAATTRIVDLKGKTVVPGLIDTHMHAIRDALVYSSKVDWCCVTNIAQAVGTIANAAKANPSGSWILVIGGWDKHQLAEKRVPTPQELDAASPDRPVFIQHQFDTAVLNKAALRALNITKETAAAFAEKSGVGVGVDSQGNPTGILDGHDSPTIFYRLTVPLIKADEARMMSSIPAFFNNLSRVGLTGVVDQGMVHGTEYQTLFKIWRAGGLSVRIRYNIIPEQNEANVTPAGRARGKALAANAAAEPLSELDNLKLDLKAMPPGGGDGLLRFHGIGELLNSGMFDGYLNMKAPPAFAAEDLAMARKQAEWAADHGYSINVHATHDETVRQFLDLFEAVDKNHPIGKLRWSIEHGEDVSPDSLRRMKALGIIYSTQDRMYFGGDKYIEVYGVETARRAPPYATALRTGVIVTGGTDGTVISPYSPFVSLQWMLTGRTASGAQTRAPGELPNRADALRIYTVNGAYYTFDERDRGSLEAGKLADLVVLDRDYLTVPVSEIGKIQSVMTMVDGRIVYSAPE